MEVVKIASPLQFLKDKINNHVKKLQLHNQACQHLLQAMFEKFTSKITNKMKTNIAKAICVTCHHCQ